MNSASVNLIYLDPPFNSNANYAAPIGSKAAGAEFKDTWGLDDIDLVWYGEIKEDYPKLYDLLTATQSIHGDSMMSYLIYMSIRIMEMKRILKDDGSIYLHCDPTASHYLKLLMDSVFGKKNFRNEIVWHYGLGAFSAKRNYPKKHDILFFYSRSDSRTFNIQRTPPTKAMLSRYCHKTDDGKLFFVQNGKQYYMKGGKPVDSVWEIPSIAPRAKERVGYPTQKPLPLLSRIIQASSNEGDVVLDPFCGCATACIASEKLNRNWVGIDISPKAAELVVSRMKNELGLFYDGIHRKDIPKRTDLGKVPRYNCRDNKERLYGIQGGFCHGCREHFQSRNLTVDHIIPKSKGGTDHFGNLQLLCGHCNSTKGNRSNAFLIKCLTDKGWVRRTERVH